MNVINKKPLVDILSKRLGKEIVMSSGKYVELVTKEVVDKSDVDAAISIQEDIYVTELKEYKQLEITKAFNSSVTALTTALPHEMVSWRKQEDEARSWDADNSTTTPFIDAQLATRNLGETKQELVNKIIANADAYSIKYAELLGKYQNLLSRLNSASEISDLETINW